VGILALIVVALLVGVAGYFYIAPPGQRTISFQTRDAVSLRGGEDVRLAGVSVGKVEGLELHDDHVTVTAKVDDGVVLGDETRVEVRLLTAVGGYFVTLLPQGERVDGELVIPVARTTVPYTVADTLQDLPPITDEVNGVPVDKVLEQIDDGLGANPDALRNIVSGLQTFATILSKQKDQVRTTLDMVSEYSAAFDASRDYLFTLARKTNTVLSAYYTYRNGFSDGIAELGNVLMRLGAVTRLYVDYEGEIATLIQTAREGAVQARDGLNAIIDQLEPLNQQLKKLTRDPENAPRQSDPSAALLQTGDICLPIAGAKC